MGDLSQIQCIGNGGSKMNTKDRDPNIDDIYPDEYGESDINDENIYDLYSDDDDEPRELDFSHDYDR